MSARSPQGSPFRREGQEGPLATFRRLEEIGRGSFATVYKATYSVSSSHEFLLAVSRSRPLNLPALASLAELHSVRRQRRGESILLICISRSRRAPVTWP